ncbi:MAG: spore cortex biosynthesis protein YabQ [Ruminococcus sp.]|nr:spore cortex biosynthesis protein YabQ [Ruminococcus sp.]
MLIPDTYLTIHEETLLFLYSCLLGAALGMVFDLFRALRTLLPHKGWMTALEDTLFLLFWAGTIAAFTSAFAKGDLRFYYIFGSILGFLLYRATLGNPVVGLLRRILGSITGLLRWCLRPVTALLVRMYRKCRGNFVTTDKIKEKSKNIHAALLIAPRKMLYNRHNRKRKQGETNHGSEEEDQKPESGSEKGSSKKNSEKGKK